MDERGREELRSHLALVLEAPPAADGSLVVVVERIHAVAHQPHQRAALRGPAPDRQPCKDGEDREALAHLVRVKVWVRVRVRVRVGVRVRVRVRVVGP